MARQLRRFLGAALLGRSKLYQVGYCLIPYRTLQVQKRADLGVSRKKWPIERRESR